MGSIRASNRQGSASRFSCVRNRSVMRDSPAAMPLGEEAGDKPSGALVGPSDETVDRLVLTGGGPFGLPTAGVAGAAMDPLGIVLMDLGHHPYLSGQSDRAVRSPYSKC